MVKLKIVLQVLQKKGYESNSIIGIYQFGSRIYNCFEPNSDWDFFVVFDFNHNLPVKDILSFGLINIHIEDYYTFKNNLTNHDPITLTTKWIPSKNIFLERNEYDLNFKINFPLIYEKFTQEKEICINKSRRYFITDKRISLKNIVHSLRYLCFAIQIFKVGKIENYEVANDYYKKIFNLKLNSWEEYLSEFKETFESLETQLKDLFDELTITRKKYQREFEGSPLTTLEFLKTHPVLDLEKYFSIDVLKKDFGYILQRKKEYDRHCIINRECNPLILDDSCENVLGIGLFNCPLIYDMNVDDWMNEKLFFFELIRNDPIYVVFLNPKTNLFHAYPEKGHLYATGKDLAKKISFYEHKIHFDKPICYIFNYNHFWSDLISVVDLITFKNLDISQFNEKYGTNEEICETRLYMKDIFLEKRNYVDSYHFCVKPSGSQVLIESPVFYFASKIRQNEMNLEEGILNIFKFNNYTKISKNIYDCIFKELGATSLQIYTKIEKKYEKMIHNISTRTDPFYNEICELENISHFFYHSDVAVLLKFLNHKFEHEEIPICWMEIKMIENLPFDCIELIFEYLDFESMRMLTCDLTSKHFRNYQSNENIAKKFIQSSDPFDFQVFNDLLPYFKTPQFQIISRMHPFKESLHSFSLNLYENLYLFSGRKLNPFENSLFEKTNPKPKNIVSYEKFIKKLNSKFMFDEWKDFLNWNRFYITGGSILNCLLEESFEDEKQEQDIDIFSISDRFVFDTFFNEFYVKIQSIYATVEIERTNDYQEQVITVNVWKNFTKLTFQFVNLNIGASFESYLSRLDIDCCQVAFNTKNVICTHSFVQSLNTGTMMNYKLKPTENYLTTLNRIRKYEKRGFELLKPKGYSLDKCKILDLGSFEPNNDELGLLEKVRNLL
jgi:hypothetical protein